MAEKMSAPMDNGPDALGSKKTDEVVDEFLTE
jgi:hypothetical protein